MSGQDFPTGFEYTISYQMGSLRGWSLHVDQMFYQDYINEKQRRVVIHKKDSTKWVIQKYNKNGQTYFYIRVSNNGGPFANWYLTGQIDNQNLYVMRDWNQASRWKLPITNNTGKKIQNDKAKRVIQMMMSPNLILRTNKKRDQFSYYPFLHKGLRVAGGQVSWRIQALGQNSQVSQQLSNLQQNLSDLRKTISCLSNQLSYYTSKHKSLQCQIQTFQSLYHKQMTIINNRHNVLLNENKPLESKYLIEKHWKDQYMRLKIKYQQQQQAFDQEIYQLQKRVTQVCNQRNQVQEALYVKFAEIQRMALKLKELQKNQQDNHFFDKIKLNIDGLIKMYSNIIADYMKTYQTWKLNHDNLKVAIQKLSLMNNNQIQNRFMKQKILQINQQNESIKIFISRHDEYLDQLKVDLADKKQQFQNQKAQNTQGFNKIAEIHKSQEQKNTKLYQRLKEATQKAQFMKCFYKENKKPKINQLLASIFDRKAKFADESLLKLRQRADMLEKLYQECNREKNRQEQEEKLGEDESDQIQTQQDQSTQNQIFDIKQKVRLSILSDLNENSKLPKRTQRSAQIIQIQETFQKYYQCKYGLFSQQIVSAFQVIFSQSQKLMEQNKQQKPFDQFYTCQSLRIVTNELIDRVGKNQNQEKKVGVLTRQFGERQKVACEVQVVRMEGWFALGIYDVRGLREDMPQTIGYLHPNRHYYYLLDCLGNVQSRSTSLKAKGTSMIRMTSGSKITIQCDTSSNSIVFGLQNPQKSQEQDGEDKSVFTIKRYVKALSTSQYRFAIVTSGSNNHFKVNIKQ